jgi:glycerol-3-phosphate dehydrogenase
MVLTGARDRRDLGTFFGEDLSEAEVSYLIAEEWARTAADVLWRRSKLGLRFSQSETAALSRWMTAQTASTGPRVAAQ